MRYEYLSHPIKEGMPVYGGKAELNLKIRRSVSRGEAANTYKFSMENHWGTHIDAPRHFFNKGACIEDYPCGAFFFTIPEVVDIVLKPSEILCVGKWLKKINPLCDILLFKSGWSRFRNHRKYVFQNPGIHPQVAVYLRKNFHYLRAIGIDWLSVSSFEDRELGRQAHRAFLNSKDEGKPLLLVEDMRMTPRISGLRKVILSPLMISGIDSAPCTIAGVFDD